MFGDKMVIRSKPTPKKPAARLNSKSRFAFIRNLTDTFYRDPYKWGLMKCVAFFAGGVLVARTLCELDILPADPPSPTPQAAY